MGQLISNLKVDCRTFTLDADILLSGNTWTDTGMILTLPSAGVYVITFNVVIATAGGTHFDNRWVEGRLFNETTNSVVPGTNSYLFISENLAGNADYFIRTGNITTMMNITRPTVVKLQYAGHSLPATVIGIDHTHTSYGYMMVGA